MPVTFNDADQSTVGVAPERAQAAQAVGLRIAVQPRFLLMFDPSRFDVFLTSKGAEILPDLIQVPEIPGVNGVTEVDGPNGSKVIFSRKVELFHGEQGAQRVPVELAGTAFRRDVADYCLGWPTATGRISYMLAWYRFRSVGARVVKDYDADGYHDFLRRVREHFLGSAGADPVIVKALQDRLTIEHGRLAQTPPDRRTPGQVENLRLYTEKLAAFKPAPKSGKVAA